MERKFGVRVVGVKPAHINEQSFTRHIGTWITEYDADTHRDVTMISNNPIEFFDKIETFNDSYIFEVQQFGDDNGS